MWRRCVLINVLHEQFSQKEKTRSVPRSSLPVCPPLGRNTKTSLSNYINTDLGPDTNMEAEETPGVQTFYIPSISQTDIFLSFFISFCSIHKSPISRHSVTFPLNLEHLLVLLCSARDVAVMSVGHGRLRETQVIIPRAGN